MALGTATPHRFSVKEAMVTVMLTDTGASGPTYATTSYRIPGCQSITISGAATQEQLEGDDVVLAVESTDEALDISIEHGQDSFDLMAALKAWISYTDGDDRILVDVPPSTTRYVKLTARCTKTGDSGGDFLIEIFKMAVANTERTVENKAFGKNSFTAKAIYTSSTTVVNSTASYIRARYTSRPTAIALSTSADTTAPTCTVSPTDGATGVAVSANITATFSEDLDPNSVNNQHIVLCTAAGVEVDLSASGVITLTNAGASTTVVVNPASNLSAATDYLFTITTGVKDLQGNRLAASKLINFQTA